MGGDISDLTYNETVKDTTCILGTTHIPRNPQPKKLRNLSLPVDTQTNTESENGRFQDLFLSYYIQEAVKKAFQVKWFCSDRYAHIFLAAPQYVYYEYHLSLCQ